MRCLVVGGNGFIGSHIAEELAIHGHTVRVLDITTSTLLNKYNVECMIGDFGDSKILDTCLMDIDVVFHTAWTTNPKTSNDDYLYDVDSNLVNTIKLLHKCVEYNIKKVVFTSSGGSIYGNAEILPISEEHATNPICSYGITKLAVEKYLAVFHLQYNLDYVVLRCSNPFGERQNYNRGQGLITTFLYKAYTDEEIAIWGDKSIVRDYIYVKDVANAHLQALYYSGQEKIFNIGTGIGTSINDIIEYMTNQLNLKANVHYEPKRHVDVSANILDVHRAECYLGWVPRTPILSAMEKTLDWIKNIKNKNM